MNNMADNICLPRYHFISVIMVFVIFTWYYHNITIKKIYNDDIPDKKMDETKKIFFIDNTDRIIRNYLKKRDTHAYYNDMKPPERRVNNRNYPFAIKSHINIPTRGYPDNYHQVGNLIRDSDEKVLKLFGRQRYPGSSQWEYYVISRDPNGLDTKLPLNRKKDRELEDNTEIDVPFFNSSKGNFKVQLLNLDAPRYNPFII